MRKYRKICFNIVLSSISENIRKKSTINQLFQVMKKIVSFTIFFFLFLLNAQNNKKPNVLFIAVDDLRPELGCYGQTHIKSPNIDKLLKSGLTFNRAYCNIPVCLSGIRPNRNRFLNYDARLDNDVPGVVSLPMHNWKTEVYCRLIRGETVNFSEKQGNKILVQQLSDKLRKHIPERDKIIIPMFHC